MKKVTSKRLLTLVLVVVFIFALSASAFAAWSSFQGRNSNNGTITTAPPTSSSPTITSVPLSTSGTVYSGIDTTPVIHSSNSIYYAYTLYNGGAMSGTAGGARLSSVNLSSGNVRWDIQLDRDANNNQQLSTPYYDTTTNTIYAGVTYYANALPYSTLAGWTANPSSYLSGGTLTIPAGGSVTLTYSGLVLAKDYKELYFKTGLSPSAGTMTGSVELSDGTNTFSLGTSSAYGGEFNLYNNTGVYVPAGTYNVTIELYNTGTGASSVSSTGIVCATSRWRLYKITGANTDNPMSTMVANGYGQINTHINTGSNKLFFGIFEGDRCYYQFDPSDNSLIDFTPTGGDDFYWAGAAKVGSSMVFGSESGKVYKRPIGTGFGNGTGKVINLSNYATNPGPVRSSVCNDGSYLYLTTRNGLLWRLNTTLTSAIAIDIKDSNYIQYSTSTPVVSENDYIYVGGYSTTYDPDTWDVHYCGAVKAVSTGSFSSNTSPITVWSASDNASVQSSVIVYSPTISTTDYLYYTTNGDAGCGYCVSFNTTNGANSILWDTASQTTNNFTLQGMAAENGYVVFGNDSNHLFIVH